MKLSLKINLLFTAIVTMILLVMSLIIYNTSRQNTRNEFEHRLENRSARTAYLYRVFRKDTTNLLKSLDANAPPQLYNKSILIYNLQGQVLYEFHDADSQAYRPDPSIIDLVKDGGTKFLNVGDKDVSVYYNKEGMDDIVVIVAAENVTGKEYINDLKQIFLLFMPGALLVTLLAGYLFSMSIVRPIRETIHDARLITSQNLSKRLYIGKRKDELAELNATFNDLLNRLEESFAIQRRFISNASHE